MIKLTPAEQHRRDRENLEAQARRDAAWQEEQSELVRRGLAEPLDGYPQRRRALATIATLERLCGGAIAAGLTIGKTYAAEGGA